MLTKRSGQAEARKSPQFCCARIPVGRPRCEREFPSDKVYRGDERGLVGVEALSPQCTSFYVIHTVLDVGPGLNGK